MIGRQLSLTASVRREVVSRRSRLRGPRLVRVSHVRFAHRSSPLRAAEAVRASMLCSLFTSPAWLWHLRRRSTAFPGVAGVETRRGDASLGPVAGRGVVGGDSLAPLSPHPALPASVPSRRDGGHHVRSRTNPEGPCSCPPHDTTVTALSQMFSATAIEGHHPHGAGRWWGEQPFRVRPSGPCQRAAARRA